MRRHRLRRCPRLEPSVALRTNHRPANSNSTRGALERGNSQYGTCTANTTKAKSTRRVHGNKNAINAVKTAHEAYRDRVRRKVQVLRVHRNRELSHHLSL